MAEIFPIRFRRGVAASRPAAVDGCPLWDTDTHVLWVGQAGTNYQIGGASVSDGDKGEIVVSSSGTIWEIEDGKVLDHLQNDTSAISNGQLLIGNTNSFTVATLTAGTGVTITNGVGTISISVSGGAGLGDVVGPASSVDNSVPRFNGTTGTVIQGSGTLINDAGQMEIDYLDGTTSSSVYPLILVAQSSGTAANGYGCGMIFYAENSTGTFRNAGTIAAVYTDVSNGSEDSVMKLSILKETIDTLTLTLASTSADFTVPVSAIYEDSATTTATAMLTIGHNSSGTPAAGFGSTAKWQLESTTTANTEAANITITWATATHASRKARVVHNVYDTAIREAMRIEASGTAAMIGFLGAAAVVRPTALTTQLTTVTCSAPGTPDYAIADLVNVAGFGFVSLDEGLSVLKALANLQARVAELEAKQQALGLLS